jgi:hypothetical protein
MNKRDLRMIKSGTLPRDADLRNGSRREGKRERERASAKQHQAKAQSSARLTHQRGHK